MIKNINLCNRSLTKFLSSKFNSNLLNQSPTSSCTTYIFNVHRNYGTTISRAERREKKFSKIMTLPGRNLKKFLKEIKDDPELVKVRTEAEKPKLVELEEEETFLKLVQLNPAESSFDGVFLIEYPGQIKLAVEKIKKQSLVGLDCEAIEMGKQGSLSLVQISDGKNVYLFDIVKLGSKPFEKGLKEILESPKIIKVVHDCRKDSEILYHKYHVQLQNVYDVQIAHAMLQKKEEGNIPIRRFGFHELTHLYARKYSEICVNIKFQAKDLFTKDSNKIWGERPLPKLIIDYSSLDAALLLPIYYAINPKLSSSFDKKFLKKRFSEQLSYFRDSVRELYPKNLI
eukprot:gene5436-6780_t